MFVIGNRAGYEHTIWVPYEQRISFLCVRTAIAEEETYRDNPWHVKSLKKCGKDQKCNCILPMPVCLMKKQTCSFSFTVEWFEDLKYAASHADLKLSEIRNPQKCAFMRWKIFELIKTICTDILCWLLLLPLCFFVPLCRFFESVKTNRK